MLALVKLVLVSLAVLLVSPVILADDGALAEALFRQGQDLVAEGNYDEACPKFAESQRLDPSTGTLLNLAACHEKQGKLATAWNEFSAALVAARRDQREDRVSFAQERIDAIEPKLSRLTILLAEANDVPGLQIQLNDTQVGRPALGVALPVDPGTHQLTVSAPGKETQSIRVNIAPGPSSNQVSVPHLDDAPQSQATTSTSKTEQVEDRGSERGATQRYVAYGLGGLGVVGLGVGTAFGVIALNKNSQSNDNGCSENLCTSEGGKLREDARRAGDVSTVAFIAGGALLATAVVLYFTAPKKGKGKTVALDEARSTFALGMRPVFAGGQVELGASW